MTDNIIIDTATRIFADLCEPATVNAAEEGTWPTALWDALEGSGLTLTWVSDTLGGAGAELLDGFAVLRAAGRANAPVPLAETLMAGWLLAQAGIEPPAGPMTIAPIYADGRIELAEGTVRGRARQVPFARNAGNMAVDSATMGSIEYGAAVLGTPVIMVLGHERCGAVVAACDVVTKKAKFPGSIGPMVQAIVPAAQAVKGKPGDFIDNAVRESARRTAVRIATKSKIVAGLVKSGKVKVVAARYDLQDGTVEYLT